MGKLLKWIQAQIVVDKNANIGHSPRIWWSELWAQPAIYEAASCLWCVLIGVASYTCWVEQLYGGSQMAGVKSEVGWPKEEDS